MARVSLLLTSFLLSLAVAQTPGDTPETHPKLQTWKCTTKGGCIRQNTALVMDALYHPVHQVDAPKLNCGEWGEPANETVCPDRETCAQNCIMEGIDDYAKVGVVTKGGDLHLRQLGPDGKTVLTPRVYLLAEDEDKYEMLKLTGGEFSFDVDVSKLPCGMNGALYLSEMKECGGKSKLNTGGAAYGTGYCDAQCFTTPFIDGVGNIQGKGACCGEMDLWEANAVSTQLAPHTCNITGLYHCEGAECGDNGVCDKTGCHQNPYEMGHTQFYGARKSVNTKKPFTVVTQFPATKAGKLKEIRRLYVQDGNVIHDATSRTVNDDSCAADPKAQHFMDLGAMEGMGESLARGMVLVFSLWWDDTEFMNWLDSGKMGPCNATQGNPKVIQKLQPDTAVKFSNVKWGEIDSTYDS